jgi:hypothetical protein
VAGASANALPDPVPEEVKQERLARFMQAVQAAISGAQLGCASAGHPALAQTLNRYPFASFASFADKKLLTRNHIAP